MIPAHIETNETYFFINNDFHAAFHMLSVTKFATAKGARAAAKVSMTLPSVSQRLSIARGHILMFYGEVPFVECMKVFLSNILTVVNVYQVKSK